MPTNLMQRIRNAIGAFKDPANVSVESVPFDVISSPNAYQENEYAYRSLMQRILNGGHHKGDRTGTGTRSLHGKSITYSLRDSVPLFTGKKVAYKVAINEMLCFLNAKTNLADFHKLNVHVWDEFADPNTQDLGGVYGSQWREWKCSNGRVIDQIQQVCSQLLTRPNSRRIIATAWNPEFLADESISPYENPSRGLMSLSPCHFYFQLLTRDLRGEFELGENNLPYWPDHNAIDPVWRRRMIREGRAPQVLDMVVGIRSNDMFLGHPFNAIGYAFLLSWFAYFYKFIPGKLTFHIGDAHIYSDHVESTKQMLANTPFDAPRMRFDGPDMDIEGASFFDITLDRVTLSSYDTHAHIPGKLAVGNRVPTST